MKKVFVSLCMASVLMGLSSCASTKNAATLSSISGEWNIIEVNGTAVVPAPGQEFPYIGFDPKTGKASTRMACPDMTVENNVLSALNKVKKYKKLGKENIALCGASNRPIVVLQKKESVSKLSDLEGKWIISEAAGEAIPDGMEKQPFIEFNIAEKRLHGNAGCNLINGAFQVDDENPSAISFPQVISTMMACPDMEVEGRVLKALNSVQSFGKLAGGGIGLYDADNNLVMVLVKN